MAKRLSDWLHRASTGWVALSALIVFLLFSALVLPRQAAKSEQETGTQESPDTSFFYSPGDLYRMAESYGQQGRQAYVRARFTFDLIWPLVYTLFLVTAVSWVFGKAFPADSPWQRANLVPLLGALFDYLENLATSLVMLRYPEQMTAVAALASVFTVLKWALLGASFLLLLAGTAVVAWHWVVRKFGAARPARAKDRDRGIRTMSRAKRWRWLLLLPLLLLLLAMGAFAIWAATGPGPMPEALAALQSDDAVLVQIEPWLVFQPVGDLPTTGLILYPGGRVDPRAYAPSARALAEEGHLVVIVPMPLNLAFFAPDSAAEVMAVFPGIERWAVGGHSLGGAMAANYASANPDAVHGLVLWASYPAASDDLSDRQLTVSSIYGTRDGLATPEEIDASRPLLPTHTGWTAIEGGNHAQFGWYGPQPGDNEATISREEQQAQIVAATLQLLQQLDE